jgi:acyl-CoA reductase-like NAD-dependent aldehyde dehydrogenase
MNGPGTSPKFLEAELSPPEQVILDDAFEIVSFAAGECIFRAGDAADGFYIIEQGEVRLEIAHNEHVDTEGVLGYLTPGWLLGELALLDGLPRSASAFAEAAVVTRRLSEAKWRQLGESHPQIGIALLRALGRDVSLKLRAADRRLAAQFPNAEDDPEIDQVVAQAAQAQRQFESWSEERVDAVLLELARAVASNAQALAEVTVAETRIGNVADKTFKNIHASLGIYHSLVGKTGIGVVGGDPERGVTEIADPAGVVLGLIPVTNPVATAIFKTLISLKARCALILSFHRACQGAGNAVGAIIERVLAQQEVPAHLVQWVRHRSSRSKTVKFMAHSGVSLILATGGSGMVKAAYRSGTPALGVGPGNAPVYVAADADMEATAASIVASKPYDNGLICGAEHNLVVDASVRDAFVAALDRHGAAVLNAAEIERLCSKVIRPDRKALASIAIGQSAQAIASLAGVERAYPIKLIVAPVSVDEVASRTAFAKEKLAPLLSLFAVGGEADAFALCRAILAVEGAGHTAIIHTRSAERAGRFGLAMPAGRILVNVPAVQGISGIATGLVPSYTLGSGTFGGNSTTDNVSYRNLQNLKRLAHAVAQRSEATPSSAPIGPATRQI